MEIKTFKIRLSYSVYNSDSKKNYDTVYVDETNDFNKLYNIGFEWNWLDVASDYSGEDKEYHRNYNKLLYGYDDNDIYLEVKYKDGFCCIELLANTPLDKHVTVYNNYKKQLITRTLFDWIKLSLNGRLSDGIGENPVAYYEDRDNEVWLSDIITDEPLDKTGCYFYVGEPIQVIDEPNELKKIEYPNYIKIWNDIEKKYTEYYDDNKKLVKQRNIRTIYNEREKLNHKAIKYALNKITEMDKEMAIHMSEIFKAYADGKTIQLKIAPNIWKDIVFPDYEFIDNPCNYRIKPEPKLRPYKNAKEFLEAQKAHGITVCDDLNYYNIASFNNDGVYLAINKSYGYEKFMELFTWSDSAWCGIME